MDGRGFRGLLGEVRSIAGSAKAPWRYEVYRKGLSIRATNQVEPAGLKVF
jgi:hypothetical protein